LGGGFLLLIVGRGFLLLIVGRGFLLLFRWRVSPPEITFYQEDLAS
jgi:hypothetical protein